MSGNWTSIDVPATSTGAFAADIMILLTDGSVLVHNGFVTDLSAASQWLRLTPDANGKYETGAWSGELNMQFARQWFGSGMLADGRVYVIGGEYCSDPANPSDAPTGETFDPQTNAWSPLNKPPAFDFVRGDCNGSGLPDGRVLIGGASTTIDPSTWSKRTAIWDPNDDSWMEAGLEFGALAATGKEDPFEEESWALLPDGSVLAPAVRDIPQAQRYVPALDQWVTCSPAPVSLAILTLNGVGVYETGAPILLPNGKVFAIGGTGQTAIFTPGANPMDPGSWAVGPSFPADTSTSPNWPTLTALDAPACLLPSGKVVCMGGTTAFDSPGYFSFSPVLLEYDPASGATTLPQLDVQPSLPASNFTYQSAMLLLPTGQLLCSAQSSALLLYTPDPAAGSPDPAWKPANLAVPSVMVLGNSYTLSGTQLNGLSQAAVYGDDAGMATNYPIVRLTSMATGTVSYLRSYSFSSMGVATGTTVPDDLQSCAIDIPADLAPGTWDLVVIANGIASDAVGVQIAARDCFLILDNSTFSIGEIDSYVHAAPPTSAVFDQAFYVVAEGYTPLEAGIDTNQPIGPQLANPLYLPSVPSPFPGHVTIAFSGPMIPQDLSLPPTPQRFTYPFSITFLDDSVFGAAAAQALLTATFAPPADTVTNSAAITLTPSPNPFILHGDPTLTPPEPWYVSRDLKVFQVQAAGPGMFGAPLATSGTAQSIATSFIQAAVTNLRLNAGTTRTDFENLAQDEGSEVLQLLPQDPTTHQDVYNFAIARVRLRDTSNATNVRVFFRTWQAQQTNAAYNGTTYARATNGSGQPIPVLGVQGDEIITIPFFAQPRQLTSQQLHLQQDDFNRHDIDAGAGETDFFFGCWLDINQPNDARYPQRIAGVSADGPFDSVSPLFPIQQFMMAAHQCLLAEIAFDPDPIAPGDDPSISDKLAQRNLAFVGAPNPGHPASRRVPQTFEVKPTSPQLRPGIAPDELMIEWGNMPAGSHAEIYLPAVSADAILAETEMLYTFHRLERLDAHTLRFPAAGVTYLPIPAGQGLTFAGLLTLDLPAGIRAGDTYTAVVRQTTGVAGGADNLTTVPSRRAPRQWRRTAGIFKLTIPVSTKTQLLAPEERYYSLLKWIAQAVPETGRWYPVMQRYLQQIAGRVFQMGGDPAHIPATGTGIWKNLPSGGHPPQGSHELRFVGKIEGLVYDRFGDFASFTLETAAGAIERFDSREPRLEELARRAWRERTRVMVLVAAHSPRRPASITLLI